MSPAREYSRLHAPDESSPVLVLIGVGDMPAIPRVDAQSLESASMRRSARSRHSQRFIEEELRIFPERATALGDHRFDARVEDDSALESCESSRTHTAGTNF